MFNIDELKEELKSKNISELKNVAKGFGIEVSNRVKKSELVDLIARKHMNEEEKTEVFEVVQEEMIVQNKQEEKESKDSNVEMIDIDLLDDSPMNFFKPLKEKKYNEVKESIDNLGLLTPIIVRPKPDGRYEVLSGHNRKNICKDLGWTKITAIVKDVDDDEAQEIMADTNIAQRDDISPMEIAKAYAIKQKALGRRQGKRSDLSSDDELKGKTEDIIGKEYEVSGMTVQRYLRLNNLIPQLQSAVDEEKIKLNSAFELGMLDSSTQESLLKVINLDDKTDVKKLSVKNIKKIRTALAEKRKPLTIKEIKTVFEENEVEPKDTVIKFSIPADFDSKVREFIESKINEEPMAILDIIKQYVYNN